MPQKPTFTLDRDPAFDQHAEGAETLIKLATLLQSGQWSTLSIANIANAPDYLIDHNPATNKSEHRYPSGGGKYLVNGWAEREWLNAAIRSASRVRLCLRRRTRGSARAELGLETFPKRGERRKINIAFTVDTDGSVSAMASMID